MYNLLFLSLLFILFFGLVISFLRSTSLADPFFIYFGIWFCVFLLIYVDQDSYIYFPNFFLAILMVVKLIALFLLCVNKLYLENNNLKVENEDGFRIDERRKLLDIAFLVGLIALPFSYLKALEINGGLSIFTVLGYVSLRGAITNDLLSIGFYSHIMIMTYVATAIRFYLYLKSGDGLILLLVSTLISLSFIYIGTGRTAILLFFSMLVVPGVVVGKFRILRIIFFLFTVIFLFGFIAAMTSKGVNLESGLDENIFSILENLRSYIAAPILACGTLFESIDRHEFGVNSFRAFLVVFNVLGVIDVPVVDLNREYVAVPWLTNVYTVYEVYFKDFSYVGLFIPSFFLICHYWLYLRAKSKQGKWIFIYAASVYPLIMQVFHDQYFSLISMHLQIVIWCLIFCGSPTRGIVKYD